MKFKLRAPFRPAGDQPPAIEKLVKNLKVGAKNQVLLGVTGSGKTFTMANVIEKTQKPTLVISHNKTLAAQLYQEFKEFFPENAVHYFVSYYDYYQPEAYIPQTDTYIDKDAKINEELDRLRHSATQALLCRPDTIIVSSVSCIYNIGSPQSYADLSVEIKIGQQISRQAFLRQLIALQFQRKDAAFSRGCFRVAGEIIEIWPATGEKIIKVALLANQITRITIREVKKLSDLFTVKEREISSERIYPAKFWVAPEQNIQLAGANIKAELEGRLAELKKQNKIIEAERLRRRTLFDLEMMQEQGYCHGIENYSRHLEFRPPDTPPSTLLDYFPRIPRPSLPLSNNFLTIIDESHMTMPQISGMYFGDRSRKETLIDFGFRLPSALDNRPLKLKEFEERTEQVIYTSATPGKYEIGKSKLNSLLPPLKIRGGAPSLDSREGWGEFNKSNIIQQLIRPTGLLDPEISVRPTKNQIPDLIISIKERVAKHQRVLITTLTKRMAEDLSEYLSEEKIKNQYLHSEIKTLERPEILKDLRLGKYDVVVGVNLLREGLDLPEVSFVAILDADKEGFLRGDTALIQTIGRASRHIEGKVIMYADKITASMRRAIDETNRRRRIQENFNKKHGITPQPIKKEIRPDIVEVAKGKRPLPKTSKEYLKEYLRELQFKMELANRNLQFDEAMKIQKQINQLKK